MVFIHLSNVSWIQFPGDHLPGVPPVPIPNTAVKPRAANGSRALGPARVGYCQVYDPDTVNSVWVFCFIGGNVGRVIALKWHLRFMRLQPNRDYVSNDDIQTPIELAGLIVKHFNPSGSILEPCAGDGHFLQHLPGAEWCEIKRGRDFLSYEGRVD